MKAFLTPLQGLAEFEQIKEKSKTNKGILQVSGCMESQKSHLMYGLSGDCTLSSDPGGGRTPRQRNL